MASTVLEWLKEECFVDIFQKEFNWDKNAFKVAIDYVKPMGGCGENFMSNLYKVKVCGIPENGDECKTLHLFLKEIITSLGDFGLFQPEVDSYLKVIPNLEEIWKSVGVDIKFGPKCYKVYQSEEIEIIVLQDLTAERYSLSNRFHGLNMDHTNVLLKKLAQFHASSVVYNKQVSTKVQNDCYIIN